MRHAGQSAARARYLGAACACAGLALLSFVAYGGGHLTVDPMFSLVWGDELVRGQKPDFSNGPTPHPLSTAIGAALAALSRVGADPETGLLVISYASLGVLAFA